MDNSSPVHQGINQSVAAVDIYLQIGHQAKVSLSLIFFIAFPHSLDPTTHHCLGAKCPSLLIRNVNSLVKLRIYPC